MFTDVHSHLSFPEFDDDRDEVVRRLLRNGVSLVIDPGVDCETSRRSIALSQTHSFVYSTVGLHPYEAREPLHEETFVELETLTRNPKVVGIGEIGLDYHYTPVGREHQQQAFRTMLRMARQLDLPAVIHSRDAWDDTLKILREEKASNLRGIMHCFSGDTAVAHECIGLGFSLSIPGILTYRKSPLPEVVRDTDIEYLLTETDAPYLAPVPFRGKRNEPAHVRLVAEKIAEIKGLEVKEAAAQIAKNALALFAIPGEGEQPTEKPGKAF